MEQAQQLIRVGGTCWYCGDIKGSHVREHVTPISRGGTDQIGNLVTACRSCNNLKGPRTLEEFRQLISQRTGAAAVIFYGETALGADLAPDLAPDPPRDPDAANPAAMLGL
jgi:5-methylcytosine-specific restriction endonuclease McrA